MISSIRKFFGSRTAARAFVIATAAVLVGACDDDDPIDPGPSHSWAADPAAGKRAAVSGGPLPG